VHDQVSAPPGAQFPHHGDAGQAPAAPRMLERSEVAARLHISERTVRRLVAAGDLTEIRVAPHSPRITADSLERHLDKNRTMAGSAA
jgi:excisionase family DNA binding protein